MSRDLSKSIKVLAFCALVSGCGVTAGRSFSPDLQWLKVEKTQQSEVSERLGVPQEIGVVSGVRMWTYYHYRYTYSLWPLAIDRKGQELRIRWTKNLTVKSLTFTRRGMKEPSGKIKLSADKEPSAGKEPAIEKKPTTEQKSR